MSSRESVSLSCRNEDLGERCIIVIIIKQVTLNDTTLKCIPLPLCHCRSAFTFDLENFSTMPTQMVNIFAKFQRNCEITPISMDRSHHGQQSYVRTMDRRLDSITENRLHHGLFYDGDKKPTNS